MKIKKIFITILAAVISMTMLYSGCNSQSTNSSVISINKTSSIGLIDTYTITFSDGSTYNFEVTNGQDGQNLDIEDVYTAYKERYPDATFEDFLKVFVTTETDSVLTVSNKALTSSLKVYSQFTETYHYGWPYQQTVSSTAIYCGSAVIYSINDDYTYMITNYHVLYDQNADSADKLAEKIVCYLYGSESVPVESGQSSSGKTYDYGEYAIQCEYVGGSITSDLAVIRAKTEDVKKINEGVTAVEFADQYFVGESAIAIGNSEDEGISVTKGIVSVDNEYINYAIDNTTRSYRSMRIDTAIYGGNSGGGLFNSDGKLIGITNAGDGEDQNINYAIPVSIVKPVVENILHYADGTVKVPVIGITVTPANSKYVYDAQKGYGTIKEDILVQSVTSGSLAQSLGIESGDILVSFNVNDVSFELNRYFDLGDILYAVRVGDSISFTYERNGATVVSTEYTVANSDLVSVS